MSIRNGENIKLWRDCVVGKLKLSELKSYFDYKIDHAFEEFFLKVGMNADLMTMLLSFTYDELGEEIRTELPSESDELYRQFVTRQAYGESSKKKYDQVYNWLKKFMVDDSGYIVLMLLEILSGVNISSHQKDQKDDLCVEKLSYMQGKRDMFLEFLSLLKEAKEMQI
jgi:hypothetical protein